MRVAPAILQNAERFERRQFCPAKREAQAVARHWIDEPGSVAGKEQPRRARSGCVERERA